MTSIIKPICPACGTDLQSGELAGGAEAEYCPDCGCGWVNDESEAAKNMLRKMDSVDGDVK